MSISFRIFQFIVIHTAKGFGIACQFARFFTVFQPLFKKLDKNTNFFKACTCKDENLCYYINRKIIGGF